MIQDFFHFMKELRNADEKKLVVVYFTSPDCQPCKQIAPVFRQVTFKYPNATFLKVIPQNCMNVAQSQQVTGTPTMLFYRNRTNVGRLTGPEVIHFEKDLKTHLGESDIIDVLDTSVQNSSKYIELFSKGS